MKPVSRSVSLCAPLLVAAALVGCASSEPGKGGHSHSAMDMKAMCEHHKQMMAGKSPAEHQAMMNEHMKSSPAEMRKHMQMMQEQCK